VPRFHIPPAQKPEKFELFRLRFRPAKRIRNLWRRFQMAEGEELTLVIFHLDGKVCSLIADRDGPHFIDGTGATTVEEAAEDLFDFVKRWPRGKKSLRKGRGRG
jgi:hypothetical protein